MQNKVVGKKCSKPDCGVTLPIYYLYIALNNYLAEIVEPVNAMSQMQFLLSKTWGNNMIASNMLLGTVIIWLTGTMILMQAPSQDTIVQGLLFSKDVQFPVHACSLYCRDQITVFIGLYLEQEMLTIRVPMPIAIFCTNLLHHFKQTGDFISLALRGFLVVLIKTQQLYILYTWLPVVSSYNYKWGDFLYIGLMTHQQQAD